MLLYDFHFYFMAKGLVQPLTCSLSTNYYKTKTPHDPSMVPSRLTCCSHLSLIPCQILLHLPVCKTEYIKNAGIGFSGNVSF